MVRWVAIPFSRGRVQTLPQHHEPRARVAIPFSRGRVQTKESAHASKERSRNPFQQGACPDFKTTPRLTALASQSLSAGGVSRRIFHLKGPIFKSQSLSAGGVSRPPSPSRGVGRTSRNPFQQGACPDKVRTASSAQLVAIPFSRGRVQTAECPGIGPGEGRNPFQQGACPDVFARRCGCSSSRNPFQQGACPDTVLIIGNQHLCRNPFQQGACPDCSV